MDPLIAWLYSHRAPNIKWELDTMRVLLGLMGHPERRLTPVLVGGTNGKGSVAAFLHAVATRAGLKAGLFTSPHLVRPEERIRAGPDDISPDAFLAEAARLVRADGRFLLSVPAFQLLWSSMDERAGHRCRYRTNLLLRCLPSIT